MARDVKFKMGSRLTRIAPFASILGLAACSGVLGIEDLHQGPAPGAGAGGDLSGGGDLSTGGDLGNASGSTQVGNGGKGQGGANGGTGATTAGSSAVGEAGDISIGEAGVGGGTSGGTVTGHVIDYWGHKITGIPVQIGATLVTTDDQGAFTIPSVAAEYDVSLVVDFSGDFPRETYGWVFQGLTRRDPTLQVYAGIARQSGNIVITPTNATMTATSTLSVALGGPDGSDEFTGVEANGIQTDTTWRGPATTQERAHGLLWSNDATSGLPNGYIGYDTALVALSNTADMAMINLNLKATATIPSGNIVGKVTPASGTSRENDLFLRFTSGAEIELAGDTTGPDTFTYLVPTIANGSTTLAAVEGDAYYGNYAVAHKDGLAAGTTGITATIPTPAKPLTPMDGAVNVDGTSQFTFLAGAGNPGAYVVSMIAKDFYDGLYVVTAQKTFTVPVVAGGAYAFGSTHIYQWRVETHDSYATVDSMSGPTGFMDEFSGDDASPTGPHTGDGSFTISQHNEFTAK
jgi:hypothetical protein